MTDQETDQKCMEWAAWCRSKGILAPRSKGNVLGRFQPSRVGKEPDAQLSQELVFLNMAIHAMADNEPESVDLACFVGLWYSEQPKKAIALDHGISRASVYYKARRFAREAITMGKVLRRIHTSERYVAAEEMATVD